MEKKEAEIAIGNRRKVSRRDFGLGIVSMGIASALPKVTAAQSIAPGEDGTSPRGIEGERPCDLLIKGGTVIDPSQNLHAVLDVATKGDKILQVSKDYPENQAVVVISAKGKIVTPGLIDLFPHIFDGVSGSAPFGGPDLNCLAKGVTTAVEGESASWVTIDGFRRYVINSSLTRVYSTLNIEVTGSLSNNGVMQDLGFIQPRITAKVALANKPAVVAICARTGGKVNGSSDVPLEGLKRALEAANTAHLPLVVWPGSGISTPSIVKMLRKGDVFSHIFQPNGGGILDANGKIFPEVREARERGVLFDCGRATIHFTYEVADKIFQQDFLPDTISTHMVARHAYKPYEGSYDLPTYLSAFLQMGLSLDQVIQRATMNPARLFDYGLPLGTLRPGTEADISIFEVAEGNFSFSDMDGQHRMGRQKLLPAGVVRSGRAIEIMNLSPSPS